MSAAASRYSVRFGAVLAGLVGLMGAVWLIFRVGFQGVFDAAMSAGFGGLALLCLYGLANFTLLGFAWRAVIPESATADWFTFCWGRAVRDSAGDVLPFSQLGGMVVGARAVMLRGVARVTTFGSMVVDVTLEMIAQIAFIMVGLLLLMVRLPASHSGELVKDATIAMAGGAVLAAAFVVVQRRGFAVFGNFAQRLLPNAAVHAGELNRAINEIHGAPAGMIAGFTVHLVGWFAAGFGLWLALTLIGHPIAYLDAVAIESLVCALRSAGAFVPAALGVQEAGYALMMPLFGLPAEIGLAVSLLKRAREITLAVPVLASWQFAEGRRAFAPASPESA